jgi:PIN domain nuclease of toxin-antitoxin system
VTPNPIGDCCAVACSTMATVNCRFSAITLVAIDSLPPIHKDPFDLLLVAQARREGITLPTADPMVAQYPGLVRKL